MSDTQPKCHPDCKCRYGWDHIPATPMSDTPRTDKLARGNHVVPTEWAEELERECNQLRKDLKDSQTAVRLIAEALGNISIGTSCSECGGEDQARVAKAFLEAMK